MTKASVMLCAIAAMLLAQAGLAAAPPRVLEATPDNGQTDVDPATRQIRIVFDQPMSRDGWSIVGGGPTFPKMVGKPQWINDRTLVINVTLQPDRDYWLSINSDQFTNFRNTQGEPAVPYPIAFSTRAAKGSATLTAEQNRAALAELRRAIDDNYSYRDLRQVDWDELFAQHGPRLEKASSPRIFARQLASMLAAAKDMHILVTAADSTYPTHRPNAGTNYSLQSLARQVPGWRGNDIVFTGRFEDGIGYILIGTWDRRAADALEKAYEALADLKDAPALIIDVRPNSGGDEHLAQQFAGCFIDKPAVYSKNRIRREGQWHGPYDRVIEPNRARPAYRGKVVVLTGPQNMSSCESFVLMMKQIPGAQLIGARTYGGSGNPKPVELSNGVTVLLPSWEDMLPDGTVLEGVGIKPDLEVRGGTDRAGAADPVLDAALKLLRADPAVKGSP